MTCFGEKEEHTRTATVKPSCEAGSNRVGKDFKQLYEEKSEELRVQTENLKNYISWWWTGTNSQSSTPGALTWIP